MHVRAYAASSRNFFYFISHFRCVESCLTSRAKKICECFSLLFIYQTSENYLKLVSDVIFFQFVTLQMHLSRRIFTGLPVRPSHKMDFRSSAAKSGHPGEGKHEGLVPRNDVLTNGFI